VAVGSGSSTLLRRRGQRSPRRLRRYVILILGAVVLALAGLAVAVLTRSSVTLTQDPIALARLDTETFAGELDRATAVGPNGQSIPLSVDNGLITPQTLVAPGEQVSVVAVVRRPGWIGWALGHEQEERLTLTTPVVNISQRWLTVESGSPVRVSFDRPVSAVAYGKPGHLKRRTLPASSRSIAIGRKPPAGTVQVAAAARAWEKLGDPVRVGWFPPAKAPVVLASPAPGTLVMPTSSIHLTFSAPVTDIFGSTQPQITPKTPGRWRQPDDHTLVFVPAHFGAAFDGDLHLKLPRTVALPGRTARPMRRLDWKVQPASILRLEQLLAQAGYLPLDWQPAGDDVERTPRAESRAAVAPPEGSFSWRYPNTPGELRALWSEGEANTITRGAVMMFQDEHGLTVDGYAGKNVWAALLADAIAGKRRDDGYSYVYVHRNVPQSLTLWHNGAIVLSSPGNTGVPAAPTQLGTFPVFEHIPIGTMSGTNPDGTHYNDPGIRYISYFNGGDAIHAFNRASFGTPQSLGCVELPLETAARVWPYTPIGTLVTIEN
jgi:hypothetical protein